MYLSTASLLPEIQFLLVCLKNIPKEERERELLSLLEQYPYDFESLFHTTKAHGLVGVVYHATKRLSHTETPLLEKFQEKLKAYYLHVSKRNMLLISDLLKITKLLTQHHIEVVHFKGPSLASICYGDITLRQFGDIDILIQPKDKERAFALLQKHHYIPEIEITPTNSRLLFSSLNVLGVSSASSLFIEVHWELFPKNYAIVFPQEMLWEEERHLELYRTSLRTLPLESYLLYLTIHGSKHLYERLLWLYDIERFITTYKEDICWEKLLKEAKKMGVYHLLLMTLSLVEELLLCQLPEEILTKIYNTPKIKSIQEKIVQHYQDKNFSQKKNLYLFSLFFTARERKRDKLKFLFLAPFALKSDDIKTLLLPKPLFFLYPLLRPLRLLRKYLF